MALNADMPGRNHPSSKSGTSIRADLPIAPPALPVPAPSTPVTPPGSPSPPASAAELIGEIERLRDESIRLRRESSLIIQAIERSERLLDQFIRDGHLLRGNHRGQDGDGMGDDASDASRFVGAP